MAKDFHDPSLFTDNVSALDLFDNSIRKAFDYSAIKGPTFLAKVLETPKPMDVSVWSEAQSGGDIDATLPPNKKRLKFYFKGRIKELHGQFLDDPCELSTGTCPEAIKRLLTDHTTFVNDGISTEMPGVGDMVRVELKPGTTGPYDLANGTYVGLSVAGGAAATKADKQSCYQIADTFDEEKATVPAQDLEEAAKNPKSAQIEDPTPPSPGVPPTPKTLEPTTLGANQAMFYKSRPAKGEKGYRDPNKIVLHITAGRCYNKQTAQGVINYFAAGHYDAYKVDGKFVSCDPTKAAPEGFHCKKIHYYDNVSYLDPPGSALERGPKNVGIHYAVDGNGDVVQGALEKDEVVHAGKVPGGNKRSIGIEMLGHHSHTIAAECKPGMFNPTMMHAVVKLVAEIAVRNDIPVDRKHIVGHDEYRKNKYGPGTYPERNKEKFGYEGGWDWDIFMEAVKAQIDGIPIILAQNSTSGAVEKSIVSPPTSTDSTAVAAAGGLGSVGKPGAKG